MAYSERFRTKAEAEEHDQRVCELKEIQEGLETSRPNLYVTNARLARVVELLLQEIT